MDSCVKRLMALFIGAVSLGPAATFAATGGEEPPMQRLAQFRGPVVVGADGNGVLADQFQTTADGPEVRYVLNIDAALGTGGHPGPPPVRGLTITLNDDVVFQNDDPLPDSVRVEVALNPVGSQLNSIVLAARGEPGSAARVSVVAVRPAPVSFGGQSILPWAVSDVHASTSLTIHNVGPSPLAFRIVFFNPDGSLAGRTSPHVLSELATQSLDLSQLVGSSGIQWSRGAVHVQWASHAFTRVSAAATLHRVPVAPGDLGAALGLDAYGPRPLNQAELRDIYGE
jgi:hypothetical protein